MKNIALICFTLLLTSCAQSSENESFSIGVVRDCGVIKYSQGEGLYLNCLDGSSGGSVDKILGPAIVNVWGSWCEGCRAEFPFFRQYYSQVKDRVQFIGINVEEKSAQVAMDYVIANGITWPSLIDQDGRTKRYFGLGVPVTWFIDTQGKVVYKKVGAFKSTQEMLDAGSKYLSIK